MDDERLKALLGDDVLKALESFSNEIKEPVKENASLTGAMDNVVKAATLIRSYHMALRVAGYTDEQAFAMSQDYAAKTWAGFYGVRG